MAGVKSTRVRNLNRLIEDHGGVAALADAVDRAASLVSQIRNGHAFGDKLARHIEESLSLPVGYLDVDHAPNLTSVDELLSQLRNAFAANNLSPPEQTLIRAFRRIGSAKQKVVIRLVSEMVSDVEGS